MTKRFQISVLLGAMVLVAATACGEGEGDATAGSGGSGGSGGGMTVSIEEPTDGASVQPPFKLRVNSSVPLGPEESGNHHIHVFFDGDQSKYEVVESDTVEITPASPAVEGLSPGNHEMNVSLRNADHSPAGVETKVMVQVGGGGGAPQPPKSSDPGGYGGGGY